jgi:hypothetical protein
MGSVDVTSRCDLWTEHADQVDLGPEDGIRVVLGKVWFATFG